MECKYINKTMNGLKKGNKYVVIFNEPIGDNKHYMGHIIFNITKQEEMDKYIPYSSVKSIEYNWEYDKLELGD